MINTEKIKSDIDKALQESYDAGIDSIMKELNDKFLIHIWNKSDADKFFDVFFDWLKIKNCDLLIERRNREL